MLGDTLGLWDGEESTPRFATKTRRRGARLRDAWIPDAEFTREGEKAMEKR